MQVIVINKTFTLEFINEEYTENINRYYIDSNIDNDYDRNDLLRDLSDEWKTNIITNIPKGASMAFRMKVEEFLETVKGVD